jgi:hypothetical protein
MTEDDKGGVRTSDQMPLGYSIVQVGSEHYMWVEDRTGRHSGLNDDRWDVYQSAVDDRIRGIASPDGGDVS